MSHPSGDEHWMRREPERVKRGVESHAAKLDAVAHELICEEFRQRRCGRTWLARKWGVSRCTIWRHLKQEGLL